MPRSCLTVASLLLFCTTANSLAQTGEGVRLEPLPPIYEPLPFPAGNVSLQPPPLLDQPVRLPPVEQSPLASPSPELGPAGQGPIRGEVPPTGEPIDLKPPPDAKTPLTLNDFMGYRYAANALEWIPGGGDQFGIFSVLLGRYEPAGIQNGIISGFGFHVFSGPDQTDMPPRVYDFSIGYQFRQQMGPVAFDLAAAVQVSSDFNGNAEKGIQYPSHGVAFITARPDLDLVLGVDYLDRADIKILPVAGLIWKPRSDLRLELVFPRPRAVFQLTDTYRLYFYGELGGGTWAIRRPNLADNLATYQDLRVCVGLESVDKGGSRSALEIGYAFDRRLQFTSNTGNLGLDDAVVIRLVTMY